MEKHKHVRELKSLRNRLNGDNLLWFDSLDKKRQYDILFKWKCVKNSNKLNRPSIHYIKKYQYGAYPSFINVKKITYPPKLKYFIIEQRKSYRFKTNIINRREAFIDIILNNK